MKPEDLKVGETYLSTIGGKTVEVKVESVDFHNAFITTDHGPIAFSMLDMLHLKPGPDTTSRASHVS